MKRQKLLTLLFASLALSLSARDFDYTYEGHTITYTVIDENKKTCMMSKWNNVSGDLVLPVHPSDGDSEFTLTEIGDYAFSFCDGLTSIIIPNSVVSIGAEVFYDCIGLTSVAIPNSVIEIGVRAFYDCIGLTLIEIPNSVTSIGKDAFLCCNSLESINVEEGNKYYCSIDGVLFNFDATDLIKCPARKTGSYNIPNSVTYIVEYAFYCCSGLTSVEIPNSVTMIGEGVFSVCSSLTSVEIPDSVAMIGDGAFSNCSSLTSVEIANSVTSIGNNAFNGCSSLTSIVIPNSVIEIGQMAFSYCYRLTSVEISNSVAKISPTAFNGCSSLESINVEEGSKYYSSIDGILFNSDATNLIRYPAGKTGSYNIPNSVALIGSYAFYRCSNLTSVEIPNSVIEIGYGAFSDCSSLTSIVIPNSVVSIGGSAFAWCIGLTSVTYNTMAPIECNPDLFADVVYQNAELIIPEGTLSTFNATAPWNKFQNITEKELGGIEDVVVEESDTIDFDAPYEVYNLSGAFVGSNLNAVASGFYIIRQGGKASKLKIEN